MVRLLAVLASLPLAAAGFAEVPKLLIVQSMAPVTKDGDPNIVIANYLAQEVDNAGRLNPIVWSPTDPLFRQAMEAGKVKPLPPKPRIADIFNGAKQLGAEYLLVCEAFQGKANAHLYQKNREIWKDTESMRVSSEGGLNPEDTARSMARTIVLKMTGTVLKDLAQKAVVPTPPPLRGQSPAQAQADGTPDPAIDDTKLKESIQQLVQSDHYATAVTTMRDAVDMKPLDPVRRSMLIELLQGKDPMAAAEEAKRAGEVLPEMADFRILAARAWLQAGKTKEAQEVLNEAIARSPDAPATRLMLAELAVREGDAEKALTYLEPVIKAGPSPDALSLRAVCRAILGGADGVTADLGEVAKANPPATPTDVARWYGIGIPVLDKLFTSVATEVRGYTTKAAVKPDGADVKAGIDDLRRLVAARVAYLVAVPAPPDQQKTHDRWLLAYKLLAQSLLDLQSFTNGEQDAITDSRVNLGEAIKQATQARGETVAQK